MNAIPMDQDIKVDLRNGFWFFFEVDDHQVTVHNSALTGRETIWVDDERVDSRTSWGKRSTRTVEVAGRTIEVELTAPNWAVVEVSCVLRHDGQEIARSVKKLKLNKASNWAVIGSLFLGGAAGYFAAKWGIQFVQMLLGSQ